MPEPRPGQPGEAVADETKAKAKRPQLYRVVLLNDDYTPMGFVVNVLETVFDKRPAEAHRIMMQVHLKGRGVCGAYPFEIAETKVVTVHKLARHEGYPLRAEVEED